MTTETLFKFACPKCGAEPHKHGKGGVYECEHRNNSGCEGVICECDAPESEDSDHGQSHANPCHNANCYHCGWHGRLPPLPKKAQAWEKKALAAGWTPPAGWEAGK